MEEGYKIFFVSPHIARIAQQKFNIPKDRIEVWPIPLKPSVLQNKQIAKRSASRFNIGLVGFLPFIYKRPDRAFELIKLLRHYDKRFTLHLYGKMPQELPWLMKREDERRKFFDLLSNMRNYGDGIIFHGHQSSMAKIYEEMGWLLSCSDVEGCHTSVAEAGCFGAIPLIFPWEGAEEVYPREYVSGNIVEHANRILLHSNYFEEISDNVRVRFLEEYNRYSSYSYIGDKLGIL